MKPIARPLTRVIDRSALLPPRPKLFGHGLDGAPALPAISNLDGLLLGVLRRWSIPALRVVLGLVFVWFGALKLLGFSPVLSMIQQTYTFLPAPPFIIILGGWEILIGTGLIFKRALRFILILLCVHLTGTFVALCLAPTRFFLHGIPLLLTADGEFVVKNLVLVAAGLVIGGYEVKPLGEERVSLAVDEN
jgi:putative oxidoreductase